MWSRAGGVSSSDLLKIDNDDQLTVSEDSRLGVFMGDNLVFLSIGQADDFALLSNDPIS